MKPWMPPKCIKLGAHRIRVIWREHVLCEWSEVRGKWDRRRYRIFLSSSLLRPDGKRLETFLHESLHAICDMTNVDLSERDLDNIAEALAAFLTDNRLLRGWRH